MNRLLYPASLLYGCGVRLHRAFTTSFRLPRPVVSIGNITWGGTGKTPAVIALSRRLVARGLKPAVLSRGYRRRDGAKNVIVSDGKNINPLPKGCGDEPYLIAGDAPGTAVVVGPDRYVAGEFAFQEMNSDVFILDDGFQHWRLKRDFDIVCVNALDPFGNGMLIPSGILREPLTALKRANLIMLMHADMVSQEKLTLIKIKLRKHTSAQIAHFSYKPSAIARITDNRLLDMQAMPDKTIAAFSGLGNNRGFRSTLESCGFKVSRHEEFRDHHWYTKEDIINFSAALPHEMPVITTAKDAVRLKPLLPDIPQEIAERIFVLKIELSSMQGEKFWENLIKDILRSS